MVVGVWTGVTGEQIRLGSFRWVWCPRYFSSIHFEPRARKCRSNLALLQAFWAVTLSLAATIQVTAKKAFFCQRFIYLCTSSWVAAFPQILVGQSLLGLSRHSPLELQPPSLSQAPHPGWKCWPWGKRTDAGLCEVVELADLTVV